MGETPREYSSDEKRREKRFSPSENVGGSQEADECGGVRSAFWSMPKTFLETLGLSLRRCSSSVIATSFFVVELASSSLLWSESDSWSGIGGVCEFDIVYDNTGDTFAVEYLLLKVGTLKLGAVGEDVLLCFDAFREGCCGGEVAGLGRDDSR